MSFVTVTNVFQSYGQRPIIERVNVTVDEGEFISIVPRARGCFCWTNRLARSTPARACRCMIS